MIFILDSEAIQKIESTHIINKITKIRNRALYLLLLVLFLMSIPFILWLSDSIYLPHQSRVQTFSNPDKNFPYIIASKEYKDVEVKLIDSSKKEIKANGGRIINPKTDGDSAPSGYLYYFDDNTKTLKKFKVVVTNKSTSPQIISYAIWTRIEEYSKFIKRIYF